MVSSLEEALYITCEVLTGLVIVGAGLYRLLKVIVRLLRPGKDPIKTVNSDV